MKNKSSISNSNEQESEFILHEKTSSNNGKRVLPSVEINFFAVLIEMILDYKKE